MDEHEVDNVVPNDSTYFTLTKPTDQETERKKEKAHTLEALATLKDILQHYDDRIAFYGSVDSIPEEVKADPQKFLIMHNANELTRNNLRSEKQYIEGLIEVHVRK